MIVNSANVVVDTYSPTVSGNAWSINVTAQQAQALANGSYTVKADVSDQAGNAANEASQGLTVSTAALSITITSPIAGDNVVNAAEAAAGFTIHGTTTGVADGQLATIVIVNSSNVVLFSFNPVVSGNAWSVTVPGSDHLLDGSYTIKADVSDQAGNHAPEASQSLTVDGALPGCPRGGADQRHRVIEQRPHHQQCGADAEQHRARGEGRVLARRRHHLEPTSAPIAAQLVQGANTIDVRQTDVAGNVSAVTAFAFTLDTVLPVAPGVALTSDTGSSSSDHITNNPALTLSSIEPGAKVEYSLDGGTTWSTSAPIAAQLVQGANTIDVRQTDVAGNVSAVTAFAFTLDTVLPVAPGVALTSDTGSSSSDHITNNPALTLSSIEPGAKVEYSLDGGTTWSTSAPIAAQLVQGANTIDVRQTDVAGNVSAVTPFAFTLDTVLPTIAITGPIAGDNVVNAAEAAAGFTIQGSTSGVADGQTATIVIVNSSNVVVDTYTPTVSGNAWSINVTAQQAQALANGSYTVKADVSDQAGNAANEASQGLTVSTAALSITITSPIAGDNVVNAAEAAAGFTIHGTTTGVADGQTATIVIVNSSNVVLFSFTRLPQRQCPGRRRASRNLIIWA